MNIFRVSFVMAVTALVVGAALSLGRLSIAHALESPKASNPSVLPDADIAIVKVGRYDKKQVLREYMREFIGGSALDKFPFPDERLSLYPAEVGEVFVVRFRVNPKTGRTLGAPLKVRFEYKFASHHHDGAAYQILQDVNGGAHDFTFKNLGDAFVQRGKVLHWRASVLLDEKVMAEKQSPIWKVVSEWANK